MMVSLLYFVSSSMSLLNHSCDPNCSIVFNGPHLLLRAVRDIEAGEEVRNLCFPRPGFLFHQRPSQRGPSLKPVVPEGQLFIVLLPRRRYIIPLPSDQFTHHCSSQIMEGLTFVLITIFVDDDSSYCICMRERCLCDRVCVFCAYDSSATSHISASGYPFMGKEGTPACE